MDLRSPSHIPSVAAPLSPLRGRAYGSSISPDSMEVMAKLHLGVLALAQKPWEATERDIRDYTEHFAAMRAIDHPWGWSFTEASVYCGPSRRSRFAGSARMSPMYT